MKTLTQTQTAVSPAILAIPKRIGLSLLILAVGWLVFGVFSHYFPFFNRSNDIVGRMITAAALAALAARRGERWRRYWLIPFGFFTAITAISVDYYLGLSLWLLPALGIIENSPAGLAINKLESSLLGIVVVLALTGLAGQKLESLYIRRGNLRLGLLVGLAAWVIMLVFLIPVTESSFNGQNLSWGRILPWTPWILIMVLSNAANEELIFRGLLIGKLEPFLGRFATNLVTTIPFVVMHAGNDYMSDAFVFLALQLLPLSLAWCWLMQKSNSIWGSLLFHAAMDIPIFVGIFSTL
jgi:membrane protease YdiL (CAAX protease family)